MGMEATSLTRTFKINGEKGSNYSKENPEDGRGVLIYLTDFGKEKENYLKNTVLKFNETVKQHISEEKLQHFIEVADTINELIIDKKYFLILQVSCTKRTKTPGQLLVTVGD
jgi:DNA-binding MarR family transcriptional regulator